MDQFSRFYVKELEDLIGRQMKASDGIKEDLLAEYEKEWGIRLPEWK